MEYFGYRNLILNGHFFREKELKHFCKKSIADPNIPVWKKNIYSFLLSWLSDSDEIEVKTSGSTGKPKSFWVKKNDLLLSASITTDFFNLKEHQNALLCLPAQYIASKLMIVRALYAKLNLVIIAPTARPFEKINEHIHFAACTPYQLQSSLNQSDEFENIDTLIIGGAALSEQLEEKLQHISTICFETYGMTETLTHVALRKVNGKLPQRYFNILKPFEFSLDNRNCLRIKTPYSIGTIQTNDIVEIKNENQLHWLGRADSIINSGGVKIYPENQEKIYATVISERFFLFGLPDDILGQKLVLVIESKANTELEAKIRTVEKTKIEKHKRAKKIIFIEEFVETHTSKIDKQRTLNQHKFNPK